MNTPNGPPVLDQWEAEAKGYTDVSILESRVIALIDLIRKKDKALKELYEFPFKDSQTIKEALALTDKVGKAKGRTTEELK